MKSEEETTTSTTSASETTVNSTEITVLNSIIIANNSNPDWTENPPITGEIKRNGSKIDLFIELKVASDNGNNNKKYAFTGSPLLIRHNNYYAVAFRYKNNDGDRDNAVDIPMSVSFSFENKYNWAQNQDVRIIAINENDYETFLSLTPYFLFRIDKNPTTHISTSQLNALNIEWNKKNPTILIYPYSTSKKLEKDDTESYLDGILTPKLAKGDLIVKLK